MSAGPVDALLRRRRLIFTLAILGALLGASAWSSMPREEDPAMPDFLGSVEVSLPGADAARVETLVVRPLERALAAVAEVRVVRATARASAAFVTIELRDELDDFAAAWAEVREALAGAELPADASAPVLRHDLLRTEAILVAITGSEDRRELWHAARGVRDALVAVGDVAEVRLHPATGESVFLEIDDRALRRHGLSRSALARQLAARNTGGPGGAVAADGRTVVVQPAADFASVTELAATPILLPSGTALPLAELAGVRVGFGAEDGAARVDGRAAVVLGVVPRAGIHAGDFGRAVRAALAAERATHAPLSIEELAYQPAHVDARIDGLATALLGSMALLAAVLLLTMGWRVGVVASATIPIVALTALGLYYLGGGILHQMSVAALVISLGMVVDNAIVVCDGVQRELDAGHEPAAAARDVVRQLAWPLATATVTTVAVFVPMMLAEGRTAAFTRAIPIVVIIALLASYVAALAVAPALAMSILRPRPPRIRAGADDLLSRLARLGVQYRQLVLIGAGVAIVVCGLLAGRVDRQFFPEAGRAELVVSVELPAGADAREVDRMTREVEQALAARPEVRRVTAFVGSGLPRFYYNLPVIGVSPSAAHLVIEAGDAGGAARVQAWVRAHLAPRHPGATLYARTLGQGPPARAPLSVELTGDDLGALRAAAERVRAVLRDVPGAWMVRDSLGAGVPALRVEIDDAAAARHGVSRADVSRALLETTRGVAVTALRAADHSLPVRITSRRRAGTPVELLTDVDVAPVADPGGAVPLSLVTRAEVGWQPAAIERRNRARLVTVDAELARGFAEGRAAARLRAALAELHIPGVTIALGGAQRESSGANDSLARALPVGVLLLLAVLLLQFNSLRRLVVVLATVPLAALGVVPGLLLTGEAFGFMSLLGVIALAGIVVNNAIILLDAIEVRRARGTARDVAVVDAVRERTRPILLTSVTTALGLLPLALGSAPLWPPMAWAMITGLLASTALTLVVVPALYCALLPARPR